MNKNRIKMLAMSAIVATTLVGCGAQASGGNEVDGKKVIRFATWDSAEDVEQQQKLVDDFNASQDEIIVKLEAYGSEYDTKISAGMGSGDAPDVMYMWNYPTYYQALEPLDSFIEGDAGYKDNFYETLWDYNMIDEVTYGIPVGFTTHALFYNKDIFEQAGVSLPTEDWTWNDLQQAAKTISENVEGVKGFSFQMKPDPYDFEMYAWSNGGAYADEEGNLDGNLNSKETQEVFTMFQNMYKDGYAIATEKNGTDEFRSGKTAMYIYGSWALHSFDEDGLNYGVVEIPSFENAGKDSVSILSSSGLAISKSSKNKDAAWKFIQYWTGEECNKARVGYELPVLKSVVEELDIMNNEKNAPFYTMLEQSQGYTPTSFIIENWSELSENLSLSFERMFNPSALEDVKVVLDEAVAN